MLKDKPQEGQSSWSSVSRSELCVPLTSTSVTVCPGHTAFPHLSQSSLWLKIHKHDHHLVNTISNKEPHH